MKRCISWAVLLFGVTGLATAEALPSASLTLTGLSAIAPLAQAILARHIDPLALAPIAYPPFDVALIPPDVTAAAGVDADNHRLEAPGTPSGPQPRARPGSASRQTAEAALPAEKPGKIAGTIVAVAQAYQRFRAGILTLAKMRLDQPDNIRQAQRVLASANQVGLARGWLATCSQIAAKAGDFIAGLTSAAAKETSPDALNSRLAQQPADILKVPGWQTASSAVMKQIAADSAIMESVAQRLIEVGYGRGKNEPDRASQAANGNYGGALSPAPPAEPGAKAKPLMAQILALAARLELSKSGTPPDPDSASNRENDQCLRWAQLNLDQCLAAAHDNNERAYCLGHHGIDERIKCWSWIAEQGT
jgi:hypothetical protein